MDKHSSQQDGISDHGAFRMIKLESSESRIRLRAQAETSFREITGSIPNLALKLAEEFSSVKITPVDSRSPPGVTRAAPNAVPDSTATHHKPTSSLHSLTPRNSHQYFQYLHSAPPSAPRPHQPDDAEAAARLLLRAKVSVWARWLLEVLIGRRRCRRRPTYPHPHPHPHPYPYLTQVLSPTYMSISDYIDKVDHRRMILWVGRASSARTGRPGDGVGQARGWRWVPPAPSAGRGGLVLPLLLRILRFHYYQRCYFNHGARRRRLRPAEARRQAGPSSERGPRHLLEGGCSP